MSGSAKTKIRRTRFSIFVEKSEQGFKVMHFKGSLSLVYRMLHASYYLGKVYFSLRVGFSLFAEHFSLQKS